VNFYYPALRFIVPLLVSFLVGQHIPAQSESWNLIWPLGAGLVMLVWVWVVFFRTGHWLQSVSLYLIIFCSGLLVHHQSRAESAQNHVSSFVESDTFVAEVKEISSKKDAKFHRWRVELYEVWHEHGKQSVVGQALLYVDSTRPTIAVGDRIVYRTQMQEIPKVANPGDFDAHSYWKNQGVTHQAFVSGESLELLARAEGISFWAAINQMFHRALDQQLTGDELALAKGILLGDKSEIRTEVRDAFSGAGAMHLLAVSGLHVGIFLVIIQFVFRSFLYRIPRWLEWGLIVAILWMYAGITGFTPSVNRAVLMFSFVALGMVYGKQGNSMNNLLVSALILLCINPLYLFDIGFQLSYLAMAGIFLFSQPISKSVYWSNKWMAKIWEGTAVAIAAQIGTFPLTLYYFHQFPTYFLITNLGLMVFSGVVLAVGLLTVSVAAVPGLNIIIGYAASWVLFALLWFIFQVHALPGGLIKGIQISVWEALVIYGLIALILLGFFYRKSRWVSYSISALLLFLFVEVGLYQSRKFSKEVYVLHGNIPAFSFKLGKQGVLVIYSNKESDEEKFQFQRRAMENYFGVPFELIQLPQKPGRLDLKGVENWQLCYARNEITIRSSRKTWTYLHREPYESSDLKLEGNVIVGRWVSLPIKEELNRIYPNKTWDLEARGACLLK
jgi:competence protein ComEC